MTEIYGAVYWVEGSGQATVQLLQSAEETNTYIVGLEHGRLEYARADRDAKALHIIPVPMVWELDTWNLPTEDFATRVKSVCEELVRRGLNRALVGLGLPADDGLGVVSVERTII